MYFFMITEMIRNRKSASTHRRSNANDRQRQFDPSGNHKDK